jgi:hypothetical protein
MRVSRSFWVEACSIISVGVESTMCSDVVEDGLLVDVNNVGLLARDCTLANLAAVDIDDAGFDCKY